MRTRPALYRTSSTKKKSKILFLALLIMMSFFFYKSTISPIQSQKKIISPLSADSAPFTIEAVEKKILGTDEPNKTLQQVVDESLSGTKGTYGIFIKNLKTKEIYSYNAEKTFETASLYKLWVMGTVYKQISEGKLKETQVLSQKIEILNKKFNISSEAAELQEGNISLTVASALKQMVTISHNYSALLLTEKVRLSSVSAFIKEHNLHNSKLGTANTQPMSTAADIGLFYEKLYKGEMVSLEYSQKMLELLKNQQKKNKIPSLLPKDVQIAHKTGELGYYSHDAGIVYTPGGDYIIVVMSQSTSPLGANERIAIVSKAVYDYFLQSLQS